MDMEVKKAVVMCSAGYCEMHLQSRVCCATQCKTRTFSDGRGAGLALLSSSTAATVNIARDMAIAMVTSGSKLSSWYKRWQANCAPTRDSGRYLSMASVPTRSRQTVAATPPPAAVVRCTTAAAVRPAATSASWTAAAAGQPAATPNHRNAAAAAPPAATPARGNPAAAARPTATSARRSPTAARPPPATAVRYTTAAAGRPAATPARRAAVDAARLADNAARRAAIAACLPPAAAIRNTAVGTDRSAATPATPRKVRKHSSTTSWTHRSVSCTDAIEAVPTTAPCRHTSTTNAQRSQPPPISTSPFRG